MNPEVFIPLPELSVIQKMSLSQIHFNEAEETKNQKVKVTPKTTGICFNFMVEMRN